MVVDLGGVAEVGTGVVGVAGAEDLHASGKI